MERNVLDRGFVRLDSYMADDFSVVETATVGFETSNEGLIRLLMRNRRGAPFEHNAFRFHVRSPIFVACEWFRYRIGSCSDFCDRYSRVENQFYVPERKPGDHNPNYEAVRIEMEQACDQAFRAYDLLLDMDLSEEVARIVLPANMYTEFYWTVNLREIMQFLSLCDDGVMREMREYAKAVEDLAMEVMPVSMQAFRDFGRVAP